MDKNILIEKHLQNNLSSKERLVFDELLKEDSTFKKEVTFQLDLKKVATHVDADNFKNLIATLENKNSSKTTSKRPFIKWMAAASVILLVGLSYMLMPQQKMSNDTIFTSYFTPYQNVVAPIVRGENNQDGKTAAFLAYEKEDYELAVTLFTELYTDTKEPFYLFYKANALLKLERVEEAVPLLIDHLKTKGVLTQKTNWYLALAYLKLNETEKAKELLEKIITNNSYHNKKANELLEKME